VPSKFDVKLSEDRVRIELYGSIDEPAAKELEAEVLKVVEPLAPRSFEVMISLAGAINCALNARPVMARIQQAFAQRARRTAYVDERPFMRGMALWVMHQVGDANAKAVSTLDQAEQWLRGSDHREEAARLRTVAA